MNKQLFVKYGTAALLIVVAAFSRLLPHPANFTAVGAIALFGGVYLDKKFAIVVPLLAMLASDALIGFYAGMYWVYGGFVLVGLVGIWLRNHRKPVMILGATVVSSIIFFVITNFGVWMTPDSMYVQTWGGLLECYVAAIPFFRNSIAGDVVFVTVMFGAYELLLAFLKKTESTGQPIVG